ncbi:hypothetical protein QJQ45_023082, partial [Haematococcus lacustris]
SSTGGTLLHGGAARFPKNTQGMVYQLPTLLPYTGDVYQPHQLEQCRLAALAHGLTIFQLPQLAINMAAVVAASILITRVYNHMVFSSVNANSKTMYGTGQRVHVVLAKSDKNNSGDLDITLKLLSDKYNAAVYSTLSAEKKKEVDEAKKVLAQYLTLLQPVLRQLLGRPLNALATIITDPTWQRCLNKKGELVTTLAKQLAQAQAPHTDFLPVGPGMDDGLVFLLALRDFPLVAYMGSHKLSQLAAAHCRRTADGKKQVVEVEDMDALALTLPHQLGTEVLVKAGQLVLFRGNTVHAGNVGVAGSCCARLYGFGRPDTVVDNTTMNTSELGDLYHGLFQPIQGEGIGPKIADWNRRGMAGQWDPVGVQQDPVVWCQDPVVPGPCGEGPGPCGARTLWTLWYQDPLVRCQNPVGMNPVVRCQDPVSQDPVDPVVWCQDPVGQDPVDPVVWCQDPVGQNPVVWCQDPVSQNPVVWCQDPVKKDTHRRTLYRDLAHMIRMQAVVAIAGYTAAIKPTKHLLSDKYNAAVYSTLSAEKKKEVDEAKKVLAQYLTLLQPVLRQLLGRPLNALATIITDPTWQRCLNKKGELVTTLAKQLAQAQAPHTDFLPVGPGMDDGLVFLLALRDFPLVAYMGSHKLSQLAAAHCRRTADGKKQVVEVEDMDALALTLPHQLGTEVLVKAGQLVLFRGNTVHAGNVGVAGSCCARLYGFGRPDTVVDNTTINTSELGDLYHGLFQPIQGEGIGPKIADWNRRGMAGQWDPVGVQQDPVVWCQDPVVPGPCGEGPGPCGARTLWTLWCQDPVVWCQDPVGVKTLWTLWYQDPLVRCQNPVGKNPVVRCQDPVSQDPVDPVVWCQDPVGQDPVVRCQNPVVWCQDPVVWCQDPVGQNPVVWCQDPIRMQAVVAIAGYTAAIKPTKHLLSDKYNAAVYSTLSAEKKKEVDEAKKVLAQYLTLLQPVLRQLLGRPLNALATIITDPTWQRCLNKKGELVTTLAKQLAQAQAPHTDFLPVGPGMDDGLVFLLALRDFPLVAYMGSHKLSQLAAAHCRRTADEVLVKAGQLVLFRGNTVYAGNVGVAGSCCARLYGFGRPDTVVDNTTMNTSELGDLYHGLFQPIQGEGIGPKIADWNRRGMAGQWDPVGVQQDPVVWCQDPVVPGPCGEGPGPCGARTLWTLWCQDPVVWCQDPVGVKTLWTLWYQDPLVRCQNPVGKNPVVRCQDPVSQDPVDPVGQDPVVRCQNPVVWCQDPVVWCQDPVGQNPVVWCQDPVSQNPVVWCQDPVKKDTHRRTLYRDLAHMDLEQEVQRLKQDPVVWCQDPVSQDPVVWCQDPVVRCQDPVGQDPVDVLPELKVIAAIIYITRVYCSMIFHSVKQHKTPKKETLYTTQYATGQRLQVLLAKTVKGTLDLNLKTLNTYTAVNSQLTDEDKAKVDEHKAVLTEYFTRLLPVLRNLMDRPLNALASIINDPVNQREMIGEGEEQEMLIELAQQAAPPQAPHTDFKPVAVDQDDGLVFLLTCQDFDLVAYMYSHLLMEQAAPYYKNGKPDLHSLGAVAAHAVLREGTLVKVKAGQLVLFRGNTVHAGTAGRPDSCGARLYGFAKTGQPADNTAVNMSQLGPVVEGVFQPTQGGTITPMTAEWNRRGQAGQMVPDTEPYEPSDGI